MQQKLVTLIVLALSVILVSTLPGSTLIHQQEPVKNARMSVDSSATLSPSDQRMTYFGNFTYLNSAILNESKLFLTTPWTGAYYENNLYVLGSSVNGYSELIRTDSSLMNPVLLYTFYDFPFSTSDFMMSASNGVYIGLVNNSGDNVLYLYNETGLHNLSGILPGSSWSLAATYNFSSSNFLIFTKSTQNSSYSILYNLSSHVSYNLSLNIPNGTSLNAFYYDGNYIYFSGSFQYQVDHKNGYIPYLGYIDTLDHKVYNLTSTSTPGSYFNIIADNLAVLDGNVYLGGGNVSKNNNSSMYFAIYNLSDKSLKQISPSGLPLLSSVTQLFVSPGNVWLATYNATDFFTINYVGLYDYNISNDRVINFSHVDSNFFDNINVLLPGFNFLIGWSYQNNTNELVVFNPSNPNSSRSVFYNNPIGNSYPYYWSGMPQTNGVGFIITGGNGVAFERNITITSPQQTPYHGFFLDSASVHNAAYVVGQSYAPNDGVFLYQYNISGNNLTNLTGAFPPSLYSSGASFVQVTTNGSYLNIFGVDNETTTANPIFYRYNLKNQTAFNNTDLLPHNLTASTLYGSDMVQSGNTTFLLTSSSNGIQLAALNSSGYHFIKSLNNGYVVPYSYYYEGFQAMALADGTLYITGNSPFNGSLVLMSYNLSSGFRNLNYLVENYTFEVSSIACANGTLYIGGFTGSYGEGIPQLLALNLSDLYAQSMSKYIPDYFGQIEGLSAEGNTLFLTGGSYPNANYGVLQVQTKPVSSLTFISSGLQPGEEWSVTVDGSQASSTENSITFDLPAGTYNYTVGPQMDFSSNVTSGSVNILKSGTAINVYIGWIRSAYSVTFNEQGLTPGSLWNIYLGTQSYSSSSGNMILNLKNGTYSFTATGPSGYSVTPSHGNFTVAGSDINIGIYFFRHSSTGYDLFINYSSTVLNQGIFWNGQVLSGNGLILTGGNGVLSVPNAGSNATTILNGNNGYYSFVQGSGNILYIGGNWYMPAGGTVLYKYYVSNSTVQSLTTMLPATWSTRGTGSSLVGMAAGAGVVMLVDSPGEGAYLQIGIISAGGFVNLTSQFGDVTGPSSVAYGNGTFLLLFQDKAFLYNVQKNTTTKVTDVNPYMADGVDGSNQYSTYVNGSFYFFNGSSLSRISSGSNRAVNYMPISSPYFVQNVSGAIYVGNRSRYGTEISLITGDASTSVLQAYGQITDISDFGNSLVLSGTDMQTFSPILVQYTSVYNLSFNPSGLPAGSIWNIYFDNVSVSLTTSHTNILIPGAIHIMTIKPPADYSSSPATINLYPSGMIYRNISYSVVFSQLPSYKVQFHETSLPAGSEWNITLDGFLYSSRSEWINTTLPSGTYTFSVSNLNDFVPVPSQGELTVNNSGVPLVIDVNFSSVQTFTVTLKETGLSSGTVWTAYLGIQNSSSDSDHIIFNVQKGTYTYSVGYIPGYETSVTSGTVVVSSNLTIDIAFLSSLYNVTFRETGIQAGTTWSLTIGSSTYSSDSTYLSVYLSNGTYTYDVSNITGYVSDVTMGEFQVNGSSQNLMVAFSPVTQYQVTFEENGLPSGSTWFVVFSGQEKYSNLSSITFLEPNGSYNYSIGTQLANYLPENSAGSLVVFGADLVSTVNFSDPAPGSGFDPTFGSSSQSSDPVLTFTESGLSFGNTLNKWEVVVNGNVYYSSGNEISASVSAGTITYKVIGISGYDVSPESGYIVMGSSSETVHVSFVPLNYVHFIFQPQGLPQGVPVTLSIAGEDYTFSPSAEMPFLSLNLPAGTYTYSTSASNGFVPFAASGNIRVGSSSTELTVDYHHVNYYEVSFVPENIQGQPFEITIDGTDYISNGQIINVSLPEGLYTYSVSSPSALKPVSSGGSFILSRSGLTQDIQFVQQQYLAIFRVFNYYGNHWNLSINGQTFAVSGNYLQTLLANGTYQYTASLAGSDKIVQGTIKIAGTDSQVNVLFPVKTYEVKFTESGLPNGTVWFVNGSSLSGRSQNNSVIFSLPSGNYSFTVSNTSLFYTVNYSFNIHVQSNSTYEVEFYHWAYISGSVLPANASLEINGKAIRLNSGNFNITVAAGNYSVKASSPGYKSFSSNITVKAGQTIKLNIDLKSARANNPILEYALYAGIALAVIIILSVLTLIMRRRS